MNSAVPEITGPRGELLVPRAVRRCFFLLLCCAGFAAMLVLLSGSRAHASTLAASSSRASGHVGLIAVGSAAGNAADGALGAAATTASTTTGTVSSVVRRTVTPVSSVVKRTVAHVSSVVKRVLDPVTAVRPPAPGGTKPGSTTAHGPAVPLVQHAPPATGQRSRKASSERERASTLRAAGLLATGAGPAAKGASHASHASHASPSGPAPAAPSGPAAPASGAGSAGGAEFHGAGQQLAADAARGTAAASSVISLAAIRSRLDLPAPRDQRGPHRPG